MQTNYSAPKATTTKSRGTVGSMKQSVSREVPGGANIVRNEPKDFASNHGKSPTKLMEGMPPKMNSSTGKNFKQSNMPI